MAKVFKGGVPYVLDVNRLKEAYPVDALVEGLVIKHGELEPIIGCEAGSGRYYGVVKSWMSQMKNAHGVFMAWQPTTGVKVLPPDEVLSHAETKTRQKISQTGRAIKLFAWVDSKRLNPTGQKRLAHQVRVAGAINDALTAAKKDLAIELAPVKSLPRPSPASERIEQPQKGLA